MTRNESDIHRGFYKRGYLPHFDEPGLYQSITFRLVDSISPQHLHRLRHEYLTDDESDYFEKLDGKLDMGFGKCWLSNPEIAGLTEVALQRYSGDRYQLIAWVVMPNHVHCVIHHAEGYPLAGIVRNWKAWSAVRANRLLGRSGKFWQSDYYDRYIRSRGHLLATVEYIHYNPVAAGLCRNMEDWQYSSCRTMNQ